MNMLNLDHQPSGNLNFTNILQVIAFDDDSLEVLFKDQSIVQLSPCGANFKYTRPHHGTLPSLSKHINEITQRCVFATSETRGKVIQAILLRNKLCSCPYLPSDLLSEMGMKPFRIHKVLKSVEWPLVSKTWSPTSNIASRILVDKDKGSITVRSEDNFAELTLFSDEHRVQVSYASVISDWEQTRKTLRGKEDMDITRSNQVMCVWQSMVFPASACPREWRYPLELAIQLKHSNIAHSKGASELKPKTAIPQTLPKTCSRQFCHTWRDVATTPILENSLVDCSNTLAQSQCSKMRYTWCENVSQWIISCAGTSSPKIEAWLPDGGVFKTHPTNDRYFIHIHPTSRKNPDQSSSNEKYEEKIISSASIPDQNPLLKSVMLRSIRLMLYEQEHRLNQSSSDNPTTCWKVYLEDSRDDRDACLDEMKNCSIQDKVHVNGVGTFSIAENSIQIIFDDRSVMHISANIRDVTKMGIEHLNSIIGEDQCRLMLFTGQYCIINDMYNPQQEAEQYVRHAIAWLEWLSLSVEYRTQHPFYSGTIYDQENASMVSQELEKICCLTNSPDKRNNTCDNIPQYLELTGRSEKPPEKLLVNAQCQTIQDVSEALSHTSKKIDELDEVLSLFKKTKS